MTELCKKDIENIYMKNFDLAKEFLTYTNSDGVVISPEEQEVHNLSVEWTIDEFSRMVNVCLDKKFNKTLFSD